MITSHLYSSPSSPLSSGAEAGLARALAALMDDSLMDFGFWIGDLGLAITLMHFLIRKHATAIPNQKSKIENILPMNPHICILAGVELRTVGGIQRYMDFHPLGDLGEV